MPERNYTTRFLLNYILPLILLIAISGISIYFINRGGPELITLLGTAGMIVVLVYYAIRVYSNESARRQSEKDLKEAREQYRALVATSSEGAILVIEQKMVYANLVFLAMAGYTSRQFSDLSFREIFNSIDGVESSLEKLYKRLESPGKSVNLESRIRHRRGDLRDVILSVSHFVLENQKGLIIIVTDVTKKERIRKEQEHLSDEIQASLLLMNLPVSSFVRDHISCNMDQSIMEAAELMERKKQDAILVTKDNRDYVGIITDTDLRNRVVARNLDLHKQVFEIMSSPLITIPDTALLFEAILKVQDRGISHLAVADERAAVRGIFSKEDLLEVQRNTISYIVKEIQDADSVDALRKIHEKVPGLVKTMLDSGGRIQNITHMISTISDAITVRLIEFAIEEMGEPPARFAFLALGSEGRKEQTMVTDQDNAIIYEDVPNEQMGATNRYFLFMGKKINDWLNKAGYDYCDGEIMAGNPQWCQPLNRWEKYFGDWISQSTPEDLLGVSIFFDFRVVYGETEYGESLRTHINKSARKKSDFFLHLVQNTQTYKPPLSMLRSQNQEQKPGHQDYLDLKVAIRPFIDFVRIQTLRQELNDTNTLQRLEKLLIRGTISKDEFDDISHAYRTLMEIRFRAQLDEILNNKLPDNYLKPEELKEIEKSLLRKILSSVSTYQSRLAMEFRESL